MIYVQTFVPMYLILGIWLGGLGKGGATKSDEFAEEFQTVFDHPLHFVKSYFNFFSENVQRKPLIKVQNLLYKFLDCK